MHARKLGALAGAVALVFGLAACGGDDEDASTDTTEAAEAEDTTTTTEADGETTTSAPEDEAGAEGEEGGAPDVNPCAPGEAGQLAPPTPPAEGATPLAVSAVDYGFEGLDITATGEYSITFTNNGNELHELALVKLTDETTPLEQLLTAEEEPETEDVAFTFACPGATAEPTAASIATPGRYVAVCFIPTGTTPETPPEAFETLGPPHAAQGMVQEIVIEA